jgi:hypothetical protein
MLKNRNYKILTTCHLCGSHNEIFVNSDDYTNYLAGQHAQHAFPYLNEEERELIISRTCPGCWETLFKEE